MSQQEWASFYGVSSGVKQRGRGSAMTYFRGTQHQRGSGLGSLFSGLFRAVMPMAKTALKAVGREALRTGVAVAGDALSGQDGVQSLERRSRQAAGKLLKRVDRQLGAKKTKKRRRRVQTGGGVGTRLGLPPVQKRKPIHRGRAPKRKRQQQQQDYLNF